MIVNKEFLIPIINREIRNGIKEFKVFEGWRRRKPLFTGLYKDRMIRVTSLDRDEYYSEFPRDREFSGFNDLIQKVLHASCIIEPEQLNEFDGPFNSFMEDEEPYRRNIRFYYDTNSLLNNYFLIFREFIGGFIKKAGHTTSYGVVAEMEDLFDRKLKNRYFPDEFKSYYGKEEEMFYNQPNLVGRFSRMAYPEIDYMKDTLRSNILTDYQTGDRSIMNSFIEDCNENNLEGIMVTNDGTMAERASKRMGSWHVKFKIEPIMDLETKLEYFINAIYRTAITYGRVQLNGNIVIDGFWKGKDAEDWNQKKVEIVECNDCNIRTIKNILEEIPEDFYGKGYYTS